MGLSTTETRVLAALIEREAAADDDQPVSLNSLRLSCNQRQGRDPVVQFDDRTVEAALVSLSSIGLVRIVRGDGRSAGYRQTADERWRLGVEELRVWAALALGGDQTATQVQAAVQSLLGPSDSVDAADALDTLAARSPEPLATRLAGGVWTVRSADQPRIATPTGHAAPFGTPRVRNATMHDVDGLVDQIARLEALVERLSKRVEALERGGA